MTIPDPARAETRNPALAEGEERKREGVRLDDRRREVGGGDRANSEGTDFTTVKIQNPLALSRICRGITLSSPLFDPSRKEETGQGTKERQRRKGNVSSSCPFSSLFAFFELSQSRETAKLVYSRILVAFRHSSGSLTRAARVENETGGERATREGAERGRTTEKGEGEGRW